MSRGRLPRLAPVVGVVLAVGLVAVGASATVGTPSPTAAPVPAPESEPSAAAGSLQNDEVVLATLDPSGLPEQALLVSTVTARGGDERTVEDPSSTTNVDYLDRRGAPQTTTDAVLVQVGGPGVSTAVTQATFDKPLPVALHAEYTLDGTVVAPAEVLGASGVLTVRYTVTNTTAQRTVVAYTDAAGRPAQREVPVFVPFAGSLTVQLPAGVDLLDTGTGVQATDAEGRPVVRYDLLLAPPLGEVRPEAVLTLRTRDGATPAAVLEVAPTPSGDDPPAAFAAQALGSSVAGSAELYDGIGTLAEQTGAAADGAAALANGSGALADGAAQLSGQVGGPLLAGSRALAAGAGELAGGADALAAGLAAAEPGAAQLASGTQALAGGLATLSQGLGRLAAPDGLPAAAAAAGQLEAGANEVADALGSASDGPWPPPGTLPPLPDLSGLTLDDLLALTPEQLAQLKSQLASLDLDSLTGLPGSVPPPTVVQALRLLQQATDALTSLTAVLILGDAQHAALLGQAAAAAGSAAAGAADLFAQVCGPTPTLSAQQCDQLAAVAADAAAAKAAVVKAQLVSGVLLAGVAGVDAALGALETAVAQVSAGVRSGSLTDPGLVEGLALLGDGLEQSTAAVQALQAGAASAASGSAGLATGAAGVAAGVGAAAGGAEQLAAGASTLADGTRQAADGFGALAAGSDALASGAAEAARGSAELAGGLQRLQVEGVDALGAAVLEASAEPALATAWVAATDARVADALPYGPPQDAVGFTAYRLTMAATSASGTPAWQWALLAAGVLTAAGWAAWRRLATPPPAPQ